MRKRPLLILTLLALLLAPILSGCQPSGAGEETAGTLQGTITISGAWALYPMMVEWAALFEADNPQVRFDISAGGAGKGMTDALSGSVDIGMVSREIYPEELDKGAFWVSVAKDAVFATVSEANPVWSDLAQRGLNREVLMGIFITGEITTWGEAIGRPEITDPIHTFTRSDAAGAPEAWANYFGKRQEDLLGIGIYGDPGLLDAVIKDPLGIGFNNLNFAFDLETGLPVAGARVVPLDLNGSGVADPDEIYDTKVQAVRAVAAGHYPSPPARDLNLVTNGRPTGLTLAFITWILTEGQQYVGEAGYVALAADRIALELGKLE
jgi:phosphate transport system substrate-binding protein